MSTKNNFKVGYTSGAFDLFHIGHLNILKKAREECDELIVGVSTDKLIHSYKGRLQIKFIAKLQWIKLLL
jgi:glycerol-3-phosphate cytidylyltransferase